MGREDVGSPGLGIFDVNLVGTARVADIHTGENVEERSPKKDFEGSVIDNLDLQIDGNGSESDWLVLDHLESKGGTTICRFH